MVNLGKWKNMLEQAADVAQDAYHTYEASQQQGGGTTNHRADGGGGDDGEPVDAATAMSSLDDGSKIPLSTCDGNKKSLFIGINYVGSKAELRGCINDVKNIKKFVVDHYKFPEDAEHMKTLVDDDASNMPTKDNMIAAFKWLVEGAKSGDSLFLHYSGHGGSQADDDSDDTDGKDETLIPVDYEQNGVIVDEDLHGILVAGLPQGVRLTIITDCCHSGSILDLPYTYGVDNNMEVVETDNRKAVLDAAMKAGIALFKGNKQEALQAGISAITLHFKKPGGGRAGGGGGGGDASSQQIKLRSSVADVIQFSGCRDDQTSADASIEGSATGAMSWSFMEAFEQHGMDQSYVQLLGNIRTLLSGKYSQVPQMSTGHKMDMNTSFKM